MYACSHCNSTAQFLAYKDGTLVRVLEDHEDVEGLDAVRELLCTGCDRWFANPLHGVDPRERVLTGELVTITGLGGDDAIKVVATGITFGFHLDTYNEDAVDALAEANDKAVAGLMTFAGHRNNTLAIRVKESGNPNTWVYRLDKRWIRKRLER